MQPKVIIILFSIALVISVGINTYLYSEYRNLQAKLSETEGVCPPGLICKDFSWVSEFVEVVGKQEVVWTDCGEGENKCARWEDYSGQNPLPDVLVKKCSQQGTRLENGTWVTGLPEGTHTMVGATIRPCEDISQNTGIIEVEYLTD